MGNDVSTPVSPATVSKLAETDDRTAFKAALLAGFTSYRDALDGLIATDKCILQVTRKNGDDNVDVLGFASYSVHEPANLEERCNTSDRIREMRVYAFEVLPAFRSSGHARALLAALRTEATEAGAAVMWPMAPAESGLEFARLQVLGGGAKGLAAWFVLHQRSKTTAAITATESQGQGTPAADGAAASSVDGAQATSPVDAFSYPWAPESECAAQAIARAMGTPAYSAAGAGPVASAEHGQDGAAPEGAAAAATSGIGKAAAEGNWNLQALVQGFSTFLSSELGWDDLCAQAVALLAVDEVCGVTSSSGEDEGAEEGQGDDEGAEAEEEKSEARASSAQPLSDATAPTSTASHEAQQEASAAATAEATAASTPAQLTSVLGKRGREETAEATAEGSAAVPAEAEAPTSDHGKSGSQTGTGSEEPPAKIRALEVSAAAVPAGSPGL